MARLLLVEDTEEFGRKLGELVRAGDLLLLAVCGGLYSVPLYAVIQDRSGHDATSRMIASFSCART